MQITEASPAVRSSLRLLLNCFVASEKKRLMCKTWMLKICACWEKTCQTSKAVKRRKCGLMLNCVCRKGDFAHLASRPVSWMFGASVFIAPLSYEGKTHTSVFPASSCTFYSLTISRSTSFISVQSTFLLLPVHGSLCSLASSSQIQRLDYKITPFFP